MAFATVRHIDGDEIRRRLSWSELVESQRRAFAALSSGEAALAPRALLDYRDNTAFAYLSRASADGWPVAKVGSVNPGNAARGLPGVHALVLVLDRETGQVAATADGETVTALRTPAATVAALEAARGLRPGSVEPRSVVVFGTGRQGVAHAEIVVSRYGSTAVTMVPQTGREPDLAGLLESGRVRVERDPGVAVATADVVILCTASRRPVVRRSWLPPRCTVVTVGSFAPDRHEIGDDLLTGGVVVAADDAATATAQCGPIRAAVNDGTLDPARVHSIGDVIRGVGSWPGTDADLVVYASVGLGVQDAAAVDLLLAGNDA